MGVVMARMPRGITRAELNEFLELDEQIKQLEVRRDVLKDKVSRAHGDFLGLRTYGVVVLDFGVMQRFDPKAFEVAHPAEQHREFYALAVDAKTIPKELKAEYVNPIRRVSIRRAE